MVLEWVERDWPGRSRLIGARRLRNGKRKGTRSKKKKQSKKDKKKERKKRKRPQLVRRLLFGCRPRRVALRFNGILFRVTRLFILVVSSTVGFFLSSYFKIWFFFWRFRGVCVCVCASRVRCRVPLKRWEKRTKKNKKETNSDNKMGKKKRRYNHTSTPTG